MPDRRLTGPTWTPLVGGGDWRPWAMAPGAGARTSRLRRALPWYAGESPQAHLRVGLVDAVAAGFGDRRGNPVAAQMAAERPVAGAAGREDERRARSAGHLPLVRGVAVVARPEAVGGDGAGHLLAGVEDQAVAGPVFGVRVPDAGLAHRGGEVARPLLLAPDPGHLRDLLDGGGQHGRGQHDEQAGGRHAGQPRPGPDPARGHGE